MYFELMTEPKKRLQINIHVFEFEYRLQIYMLVTWFSYKQLYSYLANYPNDLCYPTELSRERTTYSPNKEGARSNDQGISDTMPHRIYTVTT